MQKRRIVLGGLLAAAVAAAPTAQSRAELERIGNAAAVLKEIHRVPDKDIPSSLWASAQCVMVVPSIKKAAFIVGGEHGRGLLSCRHGGGWGAPIFMEIDKGSWGLQIGAQAIDLVLLVMNDGGAAKLLGDKVSLGVEMSIAAGPVGRDARAATDAQMHAEILSYSRTQGLFAGVNLSGGVVKPDEDATVDVYGARVTPRDIVLDGGAAAPAAMVPFLTALDREAR